MGKAPFWSPAVVSRRLGRYFERCAKSIYMMLYIFSEILLDIGLGTFYFFYFQVALVTMTAYQAFITLSGIRILFSCIGIYALARRSTQWIRLYFLLFILNLISVIFTVIPFGFVDCSCSTYGNCQVLKAFSQFNKPFFPRDNPPTDWLAHMSGSFVRVAQKPEATPGGHETSMSIVSRNKTREYSLLETHADSSERKLLKDDVSETEGVAHADLPAADAGTDADVTAPADASTGSENAVSSSPESESAGVPVAHAKDPEKGPVVVETSAGVESGAKESSEIETDATSKAEEEPLAADVTKNAGNGGKEVSALDPERGASSKAEETGAAFEAAAPDASTALSEKAATKEEMTTGTTTTTTTTTTTDQAYKPPKKTSQSFRYGIKYFENWDTEKLTPKQMAALTIKFWYDQRHARNAEYPDIGFLSSFFAAPEGAVWEVDGKGSRGEECSDPVLVATPIETLMLQSKLEELRQRSWKRLKTLYMDLGHPNVKDHFVECFDNVQCRSIDIRISPLSEDGSSKIKVCRKIGSLILKDRIKTFMRDKTKIDTAFAISFRRSVKASEGRQPPIYGLKLRDHSTDEGMKTIKKALTTTCACDLQSERGCVRDTGVGVISHTYWCYLREEQVRYCMDLEIPLYYDKKKKKYWTEELCTRASVKDLCKCSGLGMRPPPDTQFGDGKATLWENELNYGSSCADWNGDGKSWCYVGFDTVCPDRGPKMFYHHAGPDLSNMPLQFKSELACTAEKDHAEAVDSAAQMCHIALIIFWVIFGVHALFRLRMMCLIHIFVKNRCIDPVQVDQQFNVSFSDEDEDEFEDEVGGDAMETKTKSEDAPERSF